jgi:hypothetical protein
VAAVAGAGAAGQEQRPVAVLVHQPGGGAVYALAQGIIQRERGRKGFAGVREKLPPDGIIPLRPGQGCKMRRYAKWKKAALFNFRNVGFFFGAY